jgi:hypothetical protein
LARSAVHVEVGDVADLLDHLGAGHGRPDLGRAGAHLVGIATQQMDGRAELSERVGHRQADARGGAGDEDPLVAQ